MNLVVMMGRLTKDPTIRTSGTGTTVAGFRIAVDRRFKREGQPEADFFDCVSFGKQAEFVEKYIHKGTKVVVTGSMQNDNYEGRDGQMVYRNRIVLDSIEFAESKAAASGGQPAAAAAPASAPAATAPTAAQAAPVAAAPDYSGGAFTAMEDDEDLPFA